MEEKKAWVVVLHLSTIYSKASRSIDYRDSESGLGEEVNLNSNVSARWALSDDQLENLVETLQRIRNPLAHVPNEKLLSQVDAFAEEHNLLDIRDDLRRGALVAKDPVNYDQVDGLDNEEKTALYNELHHKWKQPTALYATIITCSIGAAVQWGSISFEE